MIAVRWTYALALLALGAALLGGCSEAMPLAQLPDITKLPERVLGRDEQQGKVDEMAAKAQRHQDEAAREIEGRK